MQPDSDRLWTAIRAARVAGEELTRRFRATDRTHCDADLAVPQADTAVEEHIVRIISEAFPGDNIISEETSPEFLTRDRWVVDPLDGTMNFHNGVPHFAVSIAFEGKVNPDIGVVYYLPAGRLFVGVEGGGAYLNGREIRPSGTTDLSEALIVTGFGSMAPRSSLVGDLDPLVRSVQGIRRMGAAAAELAGVAAGCFDVYFEPKLDMWDTRAGTLLVEEAGGEVTHLPAVDSVTGDVVIASNRPLHDRFLSFLSENRGTH